MRPSKIIMSRGPVCCRLVQILFFNFLGFIMTVDPETGDKKMVDTSSRKIREAYSDWWVNQKATADDLFSKCGVDLAEIRTGEDYVRPLITLFKKR